MCSRGVSTVGVLVRVFWEKGIPSGPARCYKILDWRLGFRAGQCSTEEFHRCCFADWFGCILTVRKRNCLVKYWLSDCAQRISTRAEMVLWYNATVTSWDIAVVAVEARFHFSRIWNRSSHIVLLLSVALPGPIINFMA